MVRIWECLLHLVGLPPLGDTRNSQELSVFCQMPKERLRVACGLMQEQEAVFHELSMLLKLNQRRLSNPQSQLHVLPVVLKGSGRSKLTGVQKLYMLRVSEEENFIMLPVNSNMFDSSSGDKLSPERETDVRSLLPTVPSIIP